VSICLWLLCHFYTLGELEELGCGAGWLEEVVARVGCFLCVILPMGQGPMLGS